MKVSRKSARIFISIYRPDPFCLCTCFFSVNLTAVIMSRISAGRTAETVSPGPVITGRRLCAYHTAAWYCICTGGMDPRNERLHRTQQILCRCKSSKYIYITDQFRYITRLHISDKTTGCFLSDNVRKVMCITVFDQRSIYRSCKSAGMSDFIAAFQCTVSKNSVSADITCYI